MNPNFTAVVLIILSLGLFFSFTDSEYVKIQALKEQQQQYITAQVRSNDLLKIRDDLTAKFNALSPVDLVKLEKLIPNTIDSIRLIIEMEGITLGFGVPLKNIQVNVTEAKNTNGSSNGSYNSALISFSITTTYNNFQELLKGIEKSLRMIDVQSITFATADTDIYTFSVTMKTYWMK